MRVTTKSPWSVYILGQIQELALNILNSARKLHITCSIFIILIQNSQIILENSQSGLENAHLDLEII